MSWAGLGVVIVAFIWHILFCVKFDVYQYLAKISMQEAQVLRKCVFIFNQKQTILWTWGAAGVQSSHLLTLSLSQLDQMVSKFLLKQRSI